MKDSTKPAKPAFYYGWIIMMASIVIGMVSFGIRYSFGVFFIPLETEFHLSRTATAGIFSTYMIMAGIVSIVGGWALDKYGPRKVNLAMGLFTGLSLIISSQAAQIWQMYITYGVLLALGTGAVFAAVNSTTSRWFAKKRGLAVGITSSAGAFGGVIIPPLCAVLLLHFDWRTSFLIVGAMTVLILVPVSRLMRRDPDELGLSPDGESPNAFNKQTVCAGVNRQQSGLTLAEAWKTQQFWFLVLIWMLLAVSVQMILTHIVPHAISLGISPVDAAFIISLMGMGAMIGRVVDGKISDSIGRKVPAVTAAMVQVAALVSLIFIHQPWMFYIVALFFGYGWGGLGMQMTLLVGDIFGLRSIGANMGAATSGWNVGAAIGPALGGMIFDMTGSYSGAFIIAAFGMLLATIFSMLINTEQIKLKG